MAYNPIHDYRAKDALPSGSDQKVIKGADLSDEFESIRDEMFTVGTTRNVFAAVTYDGQNTVGTAHNVGQIQWKEQTAEGSTFRFAYIPFLIGLDGQTNPNPNGDGQQIGNGSLNANLNIQVTAFSNANNSLGFAGFCFGTVTEIDNFHAEVAFSQNNFDGTHAAVWNQAFCLLVAKN
jgi:hypothetical protein